MERRSVGPPRAFSYLVCFACAIAVFGLVGNLVHLQSLMTMEGNGYEDRLYLPLPSSSIARSLTSQTQPSIQQTEEQVFRRMMRNSIASLEECEHHKATTTTTTMTTTTTTTATTMEVATTKALKASTPKSSSVSMPETTQKQRRLLEQTSRPSVTLTRFGFVNSLTNHLALPSGTKMCYYPPPTACGSQKYTLMVMSDGSNPRVLFLNLVSWLTYASVGRIGVLVPPSANATLAADPKYGNRLLAWDSNRDHKVKLQFVSTLWDANWSKLVTTEAVLWMNGDVPHTGNNRGMEAGFALWKEHSADMIASQGWMVPKATKQRRLSEALEPLSENQATSANSTQPQQQQNNGFVSLCKDESVRVVPGVNEVHIPALNGLFHHRDYLCFASHTVLRRYRTYPQNFHESGVALAIMLTQLSRDPPRLFPSTVRAEQQETEVRIRRLTQDTGIIDDGFVSTLLGYFGNMPSKSVQWCEGCPLSEEVLDSRLPWRQTKRQDRRCPK